MNRRVFGLVFRYGMAVLSLGILLFVILVLLVFNGFYGPIPSEDDLKNISQDLTTSIYDSKGELIAKLYEQDRSSVTIDKINTHAIQILIAVEDKRYYDHNGIDYRSLGRVLIKSILLQNESSGGGSTISQQLAKNLYPRVDHEYLYYAVNKLREMIIASRLERIYSKDQILALYLNTVPFGMDIYGIQSASQRIFGKEASELNLQEAATLIGSLKATTWYNPILNPENSLRRRNSVLTKMHDGGYMDSREYENALASELETVDKPVKSREALYFTQQVNEEAKQLLKEIDPGISIATSGLKIYTTLDLRLQKMAEEAVSEHLKELQKLIEPQLNERFWSANRLIIDKELSKVGDRNEDVREMRVFTWDGGDNRTLSQEDSIKHYLKFLQAGFLAADPVSGEIKAWIGGIDPIHFPYDHVMSRRQVGSTFKPFIYATALENDISPCSYYETATVNYEVEGEDWAPRNAGIVEDEALTMAQALQNSVNTVSVKILNETGIPATIDIARRAGITSTIPDVPSIALGTSSHSLKEMVEAYGAFANGGWNVPLHKITRIEDRHGKVLYERVDSPRRKVFSEKTGDLMIHFLKDVVNSGTGSEIRSLYSVNNDIGGKTGTTQNNSDGWFIGISPRLVAGAWVGGEYPAISFTSSTYGQGARMALPIYAKFYQQLNRSNYQWITDARFNELPENLQGEVDCNPIQEEFRFWDWLRNLGKKSKNQRVKSDSTETKGRFLDRIKSIFKKRDKEN